MEAVVAETKRTAKDLEAKLAAVGIQEAELRETIEAAEEDGRKTREKLQVADKRAKKVRSYPLRIPRFRIAVMCCYITCVTDDIGRGLFKSIS